MLSDYVVRQRVGADEDGEWTTGDQRLFFRAALVERRLYETVDGEW